MKTSKRKTRSDKFPLQANCTSAAHLTGRGRAGPARVQLPAQAGDLDHDLSESIHVSGDDPGLTCPWPQAPLPRESKTHFFPIFHFSPFFM
jgi:hypothetical protein